MSKTQFWAYLTITLGAASGACSASTARPVAVAGAPVQCPGATLQSAADASVYAACDAVVGDLRIRQSSLTDLNVLGRLRSVSGTLEISGNPQLNDLAGLGQLTSVGALEVRNNGDLDALQGLQNLRSAPIVTITDNAELDTLQGLEGLELADSVTLQRNGIYDTTGLANLRTVGSLVVTDNAKLISLKGLKGLAHAQSVEIRNNPRLAAYYGLLPQLQKVNELVLHANRGLSKRDVREVLERVEQGHEQPIREARKTRREASLN